MKHLLVILLTFLTFSVFAQEQSFSDLPEEYQNSLGLIDKIKVKKILKEYNEYVEQTDFDHYLPPPLPVPSSRIYTGETWHRTDLQVPQYEKNLDYKGTFVMHVADTGIPTFDGLEAFKYPDYIPTSYTGEAPYDYHSHSSHISGTYVFRDNSNAYGVLAEAAEQKKFYLTWDKICTNGGGCANVWTAASIRKFTAFYKSNLKPKGISGGISLSIGGDSVNADLEKAINEAVEAGLYVFASTGNNSRPRMSYPARYDNALGIGAHDQSNKRAWFPDYEDGIFIIGAGVNIFSTCKDNTNCLMSGTSMGNPIANACVALIDILKPEWSNEQVINHVKAYSTDIGPDGYDPEYGYGTPKWGRLIENLEEDQPDPTCNDGIKNGNETGVDCGGDCPPCYEEPDDPPTEEIQVRVTGEFPIYWHEVQSHDLQFLGVPARLEDYTVNERLQNFGNLLTVTRLDIRVKTSLPAGKAAAEVQSAVEYYFRNRGLGLERGSHEKDATYWASYFFELILCQRLGLEVDVMHIEATNKTSPPIFLNETQLKHWERKCE